MGISVKEHVDREGCIFIEGYEPGRPSTEIAPMFGKVLSVWDDDDPVQELVPIGQHDAAPNTYSGIFGRDQFPFHTDLEPRRVSRRPFRLTGYWWTAAGMGEIGATRMSANGQCPNVSKWRIVLKKSG
jgi:hypothetical protein